MLVASCALEACCEPLLEASAEGIGGSSCAVTLVLPPPNTPVNRVLSLLLRLAFVMSSVLSVLSFTGPATSPLPFLLCSLSRLNAEMRSSVDAFGLERKAITSRNMERRRWDMVSGCRGGASASGSSSSIEPLEFTGRRSTRLVLLLVKVL